MMKRRKARRNRNNKSKFSNIFISDWLKLKPYRKHTKYDELYTKIANRIYEIILPLSETLTPKISEAHTKAIALNISQYFEDIVGELGIWKVFTDMNQELHGYALPFYESDEYVLDDINPEDIRFLLWYYYSLINDTVYAPDTPFFAKHATEVFNYLNEHEDLLTSNYHNKFYTVHPTDDYFDLKTKIAITIKGNYLLNIEANLYIEDQIQKTKREISNQLSTGHLIYLVQESAMFLRSYELNAITGLDLFARLAVCDEKTRAQIRGLEKRCTGKFLYKGSEKEYHLYQHWYTGRDFKVWKKSMQPTKDQLKIDTISVMNLVRWDNKWWLSGAIFGGIEKEEIGKKDWRKADYSFYSNTEKQQEQLLENTEIGYQSFIETFGSNIYFASSPEQLVVVQEKHQRNTIKAIQATTEKPLLEEEIEKNIKRVMSMLEKQSKQFQEGAAMVYIKNEGMMFHPFYGKIVKYLDQSNLKKEEEEDLYDTLLMDFPKELTQHFIDRYPMDNLKFPVSASTLDVVKYWTFLHRYHGPSSYLPKTPNMKSVKSFEELELD